MNKIDSIVVDWRAMLLTTEQAADKILSVLACSSLGMGTIMQVVSELPKELIKAMNK